MNAISPSPVLNSDKSLRLTDEIMPQMALAIDTIATTRARLFRTRMLANLIVRPDQATDGDLAKLNALVDEIAEQSAGLAKVCAILGMRTSHEKFAKAVLHLAQAAALQNPEFLKRIAQMEKRTADLHRVAASYVADGSNNPRDLNSAIASYEKSTINLFEDVNIFCGQLKKLVDDHRAEDIVRARQASDTIDETLARLEKIGKHVRLVSLNATVEASRAGDAGRGLTVIAVEFKSLAEEIQTLSASARENIERLN